MRDNKHRVVITGYGVVAPCGVGKQKFWNGLLGPGASGSYTVEVQDWDPSPYFPGPKEARRSDRHEQYALAAVFEALSESGDLPYDKSRIGTIFGTGIGGLRTLEEQIIVCHEKGPRRVSPLGIPMMMSNASGAAISIRYGFQGPLEIISTACAAATHALGNATNLIRLGRCDAVVAGATESATTVTAVAGFTNMTALSKDEFDKGERKFLNFGHTFGHALESTSNNVIPHGIAVIIGCMIAITISKQLEYNVDDYELSMEKGYQMLKNSNLIFEKEWFDLNKLLEIIKSDKKSTGKLTMVLINNKPILADVEDIIILENILNKIYESI